MKNLSTLSRSIIIVMGIASAGTAAIAVGQNANLAPKVSEAVALTKSKISLQQALVIANKTVKGDIVSAEFDQHDRTAGGKYEVKLVANATEYEVKVDANTGKVLKTKQERLDKDDMAEYSAMKQAKMSLTQAIQKATQTVSGKVIEAGFDIDNGQSVYEIEIAKGSQVYKIVLDSMTGSIISNQLEAADNDD